MPRHFGSAGARHNYCLCFEQFILKWKAICICKLNARRALPVRVRRARAPGRGGVRGRGGVDYRDEEEVDGVVTAGGSCKIKRRLLLC